MPRPLTGVTVFVASPGDVQEERDRLDAVRDELNKGFKPHSIVVEVTRWEDLVPGAGERVEDVILREVGEYDMFVGVMWHRLGTPTGKAESGTVEEYELALEHWKATGRARIMFYFNEAPVDVYAQDVDLAQVQAVHDFRKRIFGEGVLWGRYEGADDFERQVRTHLSTLLNAMVARTQEDVQERDEPPAPTGSPDVNEDPVPATTPEGDDLLDLRLRLESKLAWVCKHLLAGPHTPTFATIGSLRYDGYLSRDDARTAARLLACSAEIDSDVGTELAIAAGPLVASFRAIVFYALVRMALERADWTISELDEPPGPRPDVIVEKDGRRFRVAPRLVTSRTSGIRDRTVARLRDTADSPPVERRLLVIPDVSRGAEDPPSADPRVVKLASLEGALADG